MSDKGHDYGNGPMSSSRQEKLSGWPYLHRGMLAMAEGDRYS